MRNLLFVGGRYYPKASPNSICIQNIIDQLPDEEYNVHVLCYQDGLTDVSKAETTKISRGFIHTMLYKLEGKRPKSSNTISKAFNFLQKLKQIPFYFILPWSDPIVTIKEIRAADRLYKHNKYDVIVAVHMPLSSLITASMMKRRHPEIRYIAYFLDSLSGGAAPRFMKQETYNRKAERWERKLLRNADKIVFMKASKAFHKQLYLQDEKLHEKIIYLDLPMLTRPQMNCDHVKKKLIVYVGSLAPAVRSPEFFLKVLHKIEDPDLKVLFVGDNSCTILNEYASKDHRISVIGRCTHEEAMQYESQAEILLNLGNKNANLTPSKVFEYMSFGKKIVSTCPVENESSREYLLKYPAALILNENMDVHMAAKELNEFIHRDISHVSYETVKSFFYGNTPDAFIMEAIEDESKQQRR